MAATPSAQVSYRRLLRAAKDLFGQDRASLLKSKAEVRSHFERSRSVRDPAEIRKLINDAIEAEEFIRRNLVQAKRTERGTYAVTLKDPDAPQEAPAMESRKTHTDFEPLAPQDAIDKTVNGPKKPQVVTKCSTAKRQ